MKILVTNDDGIDAPGLWALAAELNKIGEVVVIAPDREQSGIGTAITLHKSVRLTEAKPRVPGVKTYAVEGTPADSVILGLEVEADVAMVASGINSGANMGDDVLLSGTVGGALQGHLHGLPSIALSVQRSEEIHYEVAAKLGGLLSQLINSYGAQSVLLNVNLPNLPLDEIKGLVVSRVGKGGYSNAIRMRHEGTDDGYRIALGEPTWDLEEGTDVHAVENGNISITPLEGMLRTAEGVTFLDGTLSALLRDLRR